MSLLWFDGFESYNNAADIQVIKGYITYTVGCDIGTYGRRSSRGIRNGTIGKYLNVNIPGSIATYIIGFAMLPDGPATIPPYSSIYPFFQVYDDAGTCHVKFYNNSTGQVEARKGIDTSVIATGSGGSPIQGTIWGYYEIKITISNTIGQITVKVNEDEVINTPANKDTCNGSNAYVGKIKFKICNRYAQFDDIYICDTTGSKNNDFLGDVRIDALRPNAAGAYTDFTPSVGSNHENVDEAYGPDDDTTYNDGANVGDQDSYQMPDLPEPAGTTIYGVKTQATVRKTDAGAMKCKLLTRAGTTDDLGDEIILSDSYTTHAEIYEDNPDDSAAWQDADVNSMEPGVEITA